MMPTSPLSKLISVLLCIWTTLVGIIEEGLVCLVSLLTTVAQYVVFVVAGGFVSIVFAVVEFVMFLSWWIVNQAARPVLAFVTWRIPGPRQNMP